MFVKCCGFTRVEDIAAAAELGISAAGLIFDPRSPRFVSPAQARELSGAIAGSGVLTVGVFVGGTPQQIVETCEYARINCIQLYDGETARALSGFRPLIRAYRIRGVESLSSVSAPGDDGMVLLDAYSASAHGGTGTSFDWETLKGFVHIKRTIVAGGVSAATLPRLLSLVSPLGIDVSSGIEDAPGIKSHGKMKTLLRIVQEAHHDRIRTA
ncbi:MAG: phosphoribosylanthranilate isomerase [Spirochaetes bacterium]|nr:MAG: phosphoribosylanthranilate isomerase [Spirochaetota bacterium]